MDDYTPSTEQVREATRSPRAHQPRRTALVGMCLLGRISSRRRSATGVVTASRAAACALPSTERESEPMMREFTDDDLAGHDAEVREQTLDALRPEYSDLIPTIQARLNQ